MYVPNHFAQADHAEVVRLMRDYSFATLCSVAADGVPFATHLPLLVASDAPGAVVLEGHLARANPQWRHADGRPVLVVFAGPHHYVSPTWYAEPGMVPTWNYLAVHAAGTFRVIEEAEEVRRLLLRTVEVYEAAMPKPWRPDAGTVEAMRGGVVGFRIAVETLEGKWKLNQNHPAARRRRVVGALEAAGGEDARAVAAEMRRLGE